MRRITRHFIAFSICVGLFAMTGTLDGIAGQIGRVSLGTAIATTWMLNFLIIALLCLVVIMPVTSIADYLFTYKWPFHPFIQILLLAPMLVCYLAPWSLAFGWLFPIILLAGTTALVLPLLVYWVIFKGLDLDFY